MSDHRARIADLPPFRVGDVFPADQKTATLVQFIVATRPLVTVARILQYLPEDSPVTRVDVDQLLLASLADTKEALDAFRNADRQKCFAVLDKRANLEMTNRLMRLRRHSNPKAKGSLHSIIKTARDQAGGHWQHGVAKQVLVELENETFEIWVGDRADGSVASCYVPLAHSIAMGMSGIFDAPQRTKARRLQLLSKLHGDLFHVADAAYGVAVAETHFKKRTG